MTGINRKARNAFVPPRPAFGGSTSLTALSLSKGGIFNLTLFHKGRRFDFAHRPEPVEGWRGGKRGEVQKQKLFVLNGKKLVYKWLYNSILNPLPVVAGYPYPATSLVRGEGSPNQR